MADPAIPLLESLCRGGIDLDGDFLEEGTRLLTQLGLELETEQVIGSLTDLARLRVPSIMSTCSRSWKPRMLKRTELAEAFEKEQMRIDGLDHQHNPRVAEALYQHARRLGALPLEDPLDGIEVDLRLARALNV